MDPVWQRMKEDLDFAGRAERTQRIYLASIRAFAAFHGHRDLEAMGQADARAWVGHLRALPVSPQRLNQHLCALVFLFRKTLGHPQAVSFITWPRCPRKLPVILNPEAIARLLAAVPSPTYRMLFRTMVATGLRIQEACRLKTADLDASRGVMRVLGKGGRERLVSLAPQLLQDLRGYWREVRPVAPWLFTGRCGNPLDLDQARRVFRAAWRASGLPGRATPHTLRHTYATLLLEAGADLRLIQALLGHATIHTTERYLQVSTRRIAQAPCPLDWLPS